MSWDIHQISREFLDLLREYREEPSFRKKIDACTDNETFSGAWKVTDSHFLHLRQFCGDLTSIFPNTATVESDFSTIDWEKDDYRSSLTDFSLEGVLFCKQHPALKDLDSSICTHLYVSYPGRAVVDSFLIGVSSPIRFIYMMCAA